MEKINIGKLICEIEKRPALWDMKSSEYCDRIRKKQSWDELCIIFGKKEMTELEKKELVTVLHKKWKNIRDNFSRDLQGKKRKSGKEGGPPKATYMYSQQLQFLRDMIELRTSNSVQESHEQQQQPDSKNASSSSNPTPAQTLPTQKNRKRKFNSVEEKIIHTLDRLDKNHSGTANDDNRHFLLSLLPSLSSLPKMLNSKCRLEMMQIINKFEEYASMQKYQGAPCSLATYQPPGHLETMQISYQIPQQHKQQRTRPLNSTYKTEGSSSPAESLNSSVSNFSDEF